jgi:branched-chain amino acid aminotransferase
MHAHLLHNGRIIDSPDRVLSPGQAGLMNGWGVFSTIRVFDGVLFAWERHWARMKRDAALMHVPFPADDASVHEDLLTLVAANQAWNATLRVVIVRNRGGMWEGPALDRDYDILAFTNGIRDWGRGVNLAVQPNARFAACQFSSAKILSWSWNLTWLETAQQRGFDEVLLLNERGEVSECTSANVFAEIGGRVCTPPISSGCLPGITRELLLGEAKPAGIEIAETTLALDDVYGADSVFITSTTRELLPVLRIEDRELRDTGTARFALQEAFSAYCDRYVTEAAPARR